MLPDIESNECTNDKELYLRVRVNFMEQGISFSRWCKENNLTRQYVEKCLKFQRNGVAARNLRKRVIIAASIKV